MINARNPAGFLQQQEAGISGRSEKIVAFQWPFFFPRFFKRARDLTIGVTLWFAWPFAFHLMYGSGAHALIVNYHAVKLGARYCSTQCREWPGNKILWELGYDVTCS